MPAGSGEAPRAPEATPAPPATAAQAAPACAGAEPAPAPALAQNSAPELWRDSSLDTPRSPHARSDAPTPPKPLIPRLNLPLPLDARSATLANLPSQYRWASSPQLHRAESTGTIDSHSSYDWLAASSASQLASPAAPPHRFGHSGILPSPFLTDALSESTSGEAWCTHASDACTAVGALGGAAPGARPERSAPCMPHAEGALTGGSHGNAGVGLSADCGGAYMHAVNACADGAGSPASAAAEPPLPPLHEGLDAPTAPDACSYHAFGGDAEALGTDADMQTNAGAFIPQGLDRVGGGTSSNAENECDSWSVASEFLPSDWTVSEDSKSEDEDLSGSCPAGFMQDSDGWPTVIGEASQPLLPISPVGESSVRVFSEDPPMAEETQEWGSAGETATAATVAEAASALQPSDASGALGEMPSADVDAVSPSAPEDGGAWGASGQMRSADADVDSRAAPEGVDAFAAAREMSSADDDAECRPVPEDSFPPRASADMPPADANAESKPASEDGVASGASGEMPSADANAACKSAPEDANAWGAVGEMPPDDTVADWKPMPEDANAWEASAEMPSADADPKPASEGAIALGASGDMPSAEVNVDGDQKPAPKVANAWGPSDEMPSASAAPRPAPQDADASSASGDAPYSGANAAAHSVGVDLNACGTPAEAACNDVDAEAEPVLGDSNAWASPGEMTHATADEGPTPTASSATLPEPPAEPQRGSSDSHSGSESVAPDVCGVGVAPPTRADAEAQHVVEDSHACGPPPEASLPSSDGEAADADALVAEESASCSRTDVRPLAAANGADARDADAHVTLAAAPSLESADAGAEAKHALPSGGVSAAAALSPLGGGVTSWADKMFNSFAGMASASARAGRTAAAAMRASASSVTQIASASIPAAAAAAASAQSQPSQAEGDACKAPSAELPTGTAAEAVHTVADMYAWARADGLPSSTSSTASDPAMPRQRHIWVGPSPAYAWAQAEAGPAPAAGAALFAVADPTAREDSAEVDLGRKEAEADDGVTVALPIRELQATPSPEDAKAWGALEEMPDPSARIRLEASPAAEPEAVAADEEANAWGGLGKMPDLAAHGEVAAPPAEEPEAGPTAEDATAGGALAGMQDPGVLSDVEESPAAVPESTPTPEDVNASGVLEEMPGTSAHSEAVALPAAGPEATPTASGASAELPHSGARGEVVALTETGGVVERQSSCAVASYSSQVPDSFSTGVSTESGITPSAHADHEPLPSSKEDDQVVHMHDAHAAKEEQVCDEPATVHEEAEEDVCTHVGHAYGNESARDDDDDDDDVNTLDAYVEEAKEGVLTHEHHACAEEEMFDSDDGVSTASGGVTAATSIASVPWTPEAYTPPHCHEVESARESGEHPDAPLWDQLPPLTMRSLVAEHGSALGDAVAAEEPGNEVKAGHVMHGSDACDSDYDDVGTTSPPRHPGPPWLLPSGDVCLFAKFYCGLTE